jgi:hypothetical protein
MEKEAIPRQKKGAHFDVRHQLSVADRETAKEHYALARERLLRISEWAVYAGEAPDGFLLTDGNGQLASRPAQEGDKIKIHLTAPFSWFGAGADWVVIEKIREEKNKLLDEIFTAMTVRPCQDPCSEKMEVAHFYDDSSSNTFLVCRHRIELVASIHGRNERVNTGTDWLASVRNMLIALPSKAGLSNPHWKSLAKGLIEI